jgi:Xaa-Pro aminopeptidase
MTSHFTADFFRNNRTTLQSLFTGTAPIVLTAHGLMQRNSDTTFSFRQDSSFWYLTGIDEPDIILVIDKDKEYLIIPKREMSREAFDGSIDAHDLTQRSGIGEVLSEKEGWKRLGARLKRVQHVATFAPPSPYVEQLGLYTNPARQRLIDEMKKYNSQLDLLDLRNHLTKMRSIKQEPELAAMKDAIAITVATLKDVQKRAFSQFKTEYEVEAAITAGFRKRAAGHGYTPIVAGGKNACTLHYVQNNDDLRAGDLLLLDVGAEVENYSADITRTYAFGKTTKRQRDVHAAVVEAQEYAMSLLGPGTIIKQYEKQIEQYMGEKLRTLGLIKSISRETVREFYPHATSHFLGLDVHDVGDYEKPLQPGMVLTVEPGIYIPHEGVGVRIEDNILVTQKGVKVLTARLPKSLS